MAEEKSKWYEADNLGVKFSLPNKLTVRQQLSFRSDLFMANNADKFFRFWTGAVQLIDGWECELIPDYQALDVDNETNPRIADIVQYVGTTTAGHLSKIGAVPKND